ncbi:NAD(P)/FAD-dependent oxidoreductase [Planomonospora sp. ID82291]|uniref:flavin monoamine oxidase family protein n=1 Tax=Planomonospora sp. ID82291 TaxID=2738136 RepID=UPI0018C37EF2|nr:NAD(P)/FAD-dependent oxidoreductase [Planomonospora sp. ID82291]MBG0814606.1 FAD-dependent oxidoreductase [Planomonospora sp. ID82291]
MTRKELLAGVAGLSVAAAGTVVGYQAGASSVRRPAGGRWEVGRDGGPPPGGVVGEVTRVIVIGAGLAGLAAANALASAGVEVLVLEARDRLGGRIRTAEIGGSDIDLGAAWIHDPRGNPLTRLCERAGVRRLPYALDDLIAGAALVGEGGVRVRGSGRSRLVRDAAGFEDAAAGLAARAASSGGPAARAGSSGGPAARAGSSGGPAAPGGAAEAGREATLGALIDAYCAREADADRREWTRFILRTVVETELAASAAELSAAVLDVPEPYGGGDDVPEGGYRRLITALIPDAAVRTGAAVRTVRAEGSGVTVETTDGRTERGSHVLVTVPLGVLKAGAIGFLPALPPPKARAVAALGFGDFEKVVLRYGSRHWDEAVTGFLVRHGNTPLRAWIDATGPAGAPTLVALAGGPAGRALSALAEEEVLRRARDVLATATGARLPAPEASAVTRWRNDPFARGAYAHLTPGAGVAAIEALAAPVAGRVLFAGEATCPVRFGHADGAFVSGVREAKRLLGVPAVELRLQT